MSSKPIATLSGASLLGGIFAYTKFNSFPSLIGSFGLGSLMLLSSMRIRDGMDYGYEGAAASSLALIVPTVRRTIKTGGRAPIPAAIAVLATTSAAYYIQAMREFRAHA